MKRWILRILSGLLVLVVVAVGAIWFQSNRLIYAKHEFREHAISVPTDSATIARGYQIARVRCMACHKDSLKGDPAFFDDPMVARLVAPNVPAKLATMTDAEFAGFLLSGVRKDGTSPFVMPPPGLYHLSDADIGALIAYIRSLPVDSTLPGNSFRLMGRLGVAMGQFKTAVASYDTTQERVGLDPAWATTRHGEYLARSICTECHGMRLTGDSAAEGATPSLAGALAYSPEEFVTLLRTGTPREAGKQLTLMAEVARFAFTHLTDEEISAIYQYIKALPATGVATR